MRKTLLITTLLTITLLAGCQAKNRFHQPHPARSQLRRPTPTGKQLKKPSRPIHRLGCLTNNSFLSKLKTVFLMTSPFQILLK